MIRAGAIAAIILAAMPASAAAEMSCGEHLAAVHERASLTAPYRITEEFGAFTSGQPYGSMTVVTDVVPPDRLHQIRVTNSGHVSELLVIGALVMTSEDSHWKTLDEDGSTVAFRKALRATLPFADVIRGRPTCAGEPPSRISWKSGPEATPIDHHLAIDPATGLPSLLLEEFTVNGKLYARRLKSYRFDKLLQVNRPAP